MMTLQILSLVRFVGIRIMRIYFFSAITARLPPIPTVLDSMMYLLVLGIAVDVKHRVLFGRLPIHQRGLRGHKTVGAVVRGHNSGDCRVGTK